MRRTLYAVLAVALIAGLAASAQAGTTLQFPITVIFNADQINLTTDVVDPLTWGTVGADQDILSNRAGGQIRINVENIGYSRVDYTVLGACTTGWTLTQALDPTGDNNCTLAGIFTAPVLEAENPGTYGRDLVIGDFAANDIVPTAAAAQASATVLARDDTGTDDDPVYMKGFNVPENVGGTTVRSLRFMLQTPQSVAGSGTAEQTINVTLGGTVVAW